MAGGPPSSRSVPDEARALRKKKQCSARLKECNENRFYGSRSTIDLKGQVKPSNSALETDFFFFFFVKMGYDLGLPRHIGGLYWAICGIIKGKDR